MSNNIDWWRGAVIYQVYPRSLNDSNNDGIGDIAGIIEKLDYISSLEVDAIWVSPCFKSPMKDFGYDISDYRSIDPIFGELADFDKLIEKAHALGIKIMIDQVLSHTSDQHEWFSQSRQDKTNAKSDWYVWSDPNPDGTPPNNWQSIFGGPAWQWDSRRCQYYLHNFLASQPDLNFHNPDVQQAVLDNVEFWLKRGVDGLRLDAITFCFHDQALRDNPAKPENERAGRGFSEDNPYAYQYHYFNNERPENLGFIESIRSLLDRYPGTVSLGEISSEDSLATMAEYSKGDDRLHMTYSFELLTDDFSVDYIKNTVLTLENALTDGWPCWAVGNHDVARVVSRWGNNTNNPDFAKMVTAMLGCLRGSLCIYQGEELGLTEANVPYDQLQDPYGVEFWPTFKGRDGCRTPMPWNNEATHAGFTQGQPWLPVDPAHLEKSVNIQQAQKDSILNAYRAFMHWRKAQPALVLGDIEFLDWHNSCLTIKRVDPVSGQTIIAVFNLSASEVKLESALVKETQQIKLDLHNNGEINGQELTIAAFGVFFSTFQ